MLKEDYSDMIRAASSLLSEVMLTRLEPLLAAGPSLDAQVQALLRELGLQLMAHLFDGLARELSAGARHLGYLAHARKRVTFKVLFGAVEVESPQLRHRDSGHDVRPLKDLFGVEVQRRCHARADRLWRREVVPAGG